MTIFQMYVITISPPAKDEKLASPSQLIETMAQTLGMSQAACDSTWKQLRASQLVVNSGKGNRGTQVSARDCAAFLITLVGADHVKDSVEALHRYSNLMSEVEVSHSPHFTAVLPAIAGLGMHHTLQDAVTAIIADYTIGPRTYEAQMILPDGKSAPYTDHLTVHLTIESPRAQAALSINYANQVTYVKRRSAAEMFASIAGSKSRITSTGDLRIEKRVTQTTFNALGRLLRE